MEKIRCIPDDNELAERIMKHIRREAVSKYAYLEKPIYHLSLCAADRVRCLGANYKTLYYNPEDVTEMFDKAPEKLISALVHAVLHCMLLHPSICTGKNELFDNAADIMVNAMLENESIASDVQQWRSECRTLMSDHDCSCAAELYNKALTDKKLKKQMNRILSKQSLDDHSVWHIAADDPSGAEGGDEAARSDWKQLLAEAEAMSGRIYGTGSGNIFAPIKPPDRFSRFSYDEYIRRFAKTEIADEDPETIDMLLYTTSMEMYGDIPIVEWNEIREYCDPSDIIIAIDMSGSCAGETAASFLRQVYTLFDEMKIRSNVNIHTVFFDTSIIEETVIRNKHDADRFISEYTPFGFGGTDFKCVFDYADNFSRKANGKRLKGLFFFSDACGFFPDKKKDYPTTFFVPRNVSGFPDRFVPQWVELVHYDD